MFDSRELQSSSPYKSWTGVSFPGVLVQLYCTFITGSPCVPIRRAQHLLSTSLPELPANRSPRFLDFWKLPCFLILNRGEGVRESGDMRRGALIFQRTALCNSEVQNSRLSSAIGCHLSYLQQRTPFHSMPVTRKRDVLLLNAHLCRPLCRH